MSSLVEDVHAALIDDVNAALVALRRPGLILSEERYSPGLTDLNSAYQSHDPREFPYAYGGKVQVKGIQALIEHDLRTPRGKFIHLVLYTTQEGRVGFVLPNPEDRANKKISVFSYGKVETEMITEIARQLTERLRDSRKVVEGC